MSAGGASEAGGKSCRVVSIKAGYGVDGEVVPEPAERAAALTDQRGILSTNEKTVSPSNGTDGTISESM